MRARRAAGAAVDDELLGLLRDLGVEVVQQHPQRRLGLPRARVQLRPARRADPARGRRRAPRPRVDVRSRSTLRIASPPPRPRASEARLLREPPPAPRRRETTKKTGRRTTTARPRSSPRGRATRMIDEHPVARTRCRGRAEPRYGTLGEAPRAASRQQRAHASAPDLEPRTAARIEPSRIASQRARCRPTSERSSRSRSESSRTASWVARTPRPGLERGQELDRLRAREQLDRERALGVREHLERLQPRRVPHRDVILLAGARRDRVDARGMAERPCSRRRAPRRRTAGS